MADTQNKSKTPNETAMSRLPMQSNWQSPEMSVYSPFGLLRRFAGEMDDLFEDFGLRQWPSRGNRTMSGLASAWPQIDILQKEGEYVVRADVPGLKKEDLHVEVRDDQLSISGERKDEREEQKGEYYRAERTYGRFERRIQLPQGTNPDDIRCTFENGTLEIRMKAPQSDARNGRQIEIQDKSKSDSSGRAA